VRYNDTEIAKSDELVERVTRTKPGTTVPVEVIRDRQRKTLRVNVGTLELDEQGRSGDASSDTGFGLSLRDLNAQIRRQVDLPADRDGAVVTAVEPGRAAAQAGVRPGDVILEVNRSGVSSAVDTTAALRRTPEGDPAFLLVWRRGQELFLTMSPQ
jgi:serine protease Do